MMNTSPRFPRLSRNTSRTAFPIVALSAFCICVVLSTGADTLLAQSDSADESLITMEPVDYISAAQRLIEFGQPQLAAVKLEQGLQEWPQSPELAMNLARQHLTGRPYKPERALELMDELVHRLPERNDARYLLAEAAFAASGMLIGSRDETLQRNYQALLSGAREQLKLLTQTQEFAADACFLLGEISRRDMENVPRSHPSFNELKQRANFDALVAFEQALKSNPKHPKALRAAADVALQLGDPEKAQGFVDTLLTVTTPDVRVHELRAQIAWATHPVNLDQLIDAMSEVVTVIESTPNILTLSLARSMKSSPDMKPEAIATALAALSRVFSDELRRDQLFALAERFLPDVTGEPCKRNPDAGERSASLPEFSYLMAHYDHQIASMNDDPQSAKNQLILAARYLEHCTELAQRLEDVAYLRAVVLLQLGAWDKAAQAVEVLSTLMPNDFGASLLKESLPDMRAGIVTIDHCLRYVAALEQVMGGRERIALLEGLALEVPQWAPLRIFLAWEHYQELRFDMAHEGFKVALASRPDSVRALQGMALCQIRHSEWAQAQETLMRLLTINPRLGDESRLLAMVEGVVEEQFDGLAIQLLQDAMRQGVEPKKRAELLDQALGMAPKVYLILLERARTAIALEDHELAAELSLRLSASAATPEEVFLAHNLAAAVATLHGREADALKEYELALDVAAANEATWTISAASVSSTRVALAKAALSANQHSITDRALREIPRRGESLSAWAMHPDVQSLVQQSSLPQTTEGLEVHAQMGLGQIANYDVETLLTVEGGGVTSKIQRKFSVRLMALSTLATKGYWEFRVQLFNSASDPELKAIEDFSFDMTVSPWFGLLTHTCDPRHAAFDMSIPVVKAITEAFTIGLGSAEVRPPYQWNNDWVDGRFSLGSGEACGCFLDTLDEKGITLKRLCIADYRDTVFAERRWEPRSQIQIAVTNDPVSRLPTTLVVRQMKRTLLKELPDVQERFDGIKFTLRP